MYHSNGDDTLSGCHDSSTPHLVLDVVQAKLEHDSIRVLVPGHGLVVGGPHSTAFDGTRKDHLYTNVRHVVYEERSRTRSMRGRGGEAGGKRSWFVPVQVCPGTSVSPLPSSETSRPTAGTCLLWGKLKTPDLGSSRKSGQGFGFTRYTKIISKQRNFICAPPWTARRWS